MEIFKIDTISIPIEKRDKNYLQKLFFTKKMDDFLAAYIRILFLVNK